MPDLPGVPDLPSLPPDESPPAPLGSDLFHVVVVGLMGSGKTTVGSRLADELGWHFDDSDASIEAAHGCTVRELREQLGTDQMHELEYAHLLSALATADRSVVAPAASIVDVDRCRDALRSPGILVIWLSATPATLARRFRDQAHRPWYGTDPAQFLAEQADRRDPFLQALAGVIVHVDDTTVEQVASACIAALQDHVEAKPRGQDTGNAGYRGS